MQKPLEKAFEIRNAKISFVSLVDKAANKRTFLLIKQEGGVATFQTNGRIIKAEPAGHYVTGIVYEPAVEDADGNFMSEEEITKAAHWFMKNGNKIDLQHSFEPMEDARVVESWVAKSDTEIEGQTVKKGTWVMTVEVNNDAVWKAIEKGEITGFSMGGVGDYSTEDVQLEKSESAPTSSKVEPVPVEKAGRAMSMKNLDTLRTIRQSIDEFIKVFEPEDGSPQDESGAPQEPEKSPNGTTPPGTQKATQGDDRGQEGQNSDNKPTESAETPGEGPSEEDESKQKPASKSMKGENDMAKEATTAPVINGEFLEKAVEAAVQKALNHEAEETTPAAQAQPTAEQIQEMIEKAVQKAVDPILKTRANPTNLNSETNQPAKEQEQHYLHGLL